MLELFGMIKSEQWNAISAIGQLLGALATFLAAFIALRTANDARKSFSTDLRPYVAFDNIEPTIFKRGYNEKIVLMREKPKIKDGIQIGIVLRNVGKTLASYKINKLLVEVCGVSHSNFEFESNTGVIYPGMISTYRYPLIELDLPENQFSGRIEYSLEYSKTDTDIIYVSEKKLSFDIFLEKDRVNWRYVITFESETSKPRNITTRIANFLGI
jgi:hypothetical protein